MSPRAPALPPSERRAALVEAALTLIREHGSTPSTKEIAEAAGVAEGTIFRAFGTKEELIDEVIAWTFCPAPLVRHLQDIDVTLSLRDRLVAMTTVLQNRFCEVFDLMVGLHLSAPPMDRIKDHASCRPETGHVARGGHAGVGPCGPTHRHRDNRHRDNRHRDNPHRDNPHGGELDRGEATRTVISLIEPDADLLTCTPRELARYLRLLTFSGSHSAITDGELLTPETIVDIVLNGLLDPTPAARGRAAGIPTSRPTSATRTRKAH